MSLPPPSAPLSNVLRAVSDVEEKARVHWTPERLGKLTAGKKLPLVPSVHAAFLHAVGLLNKDASLSQDSVKKYLQINHMVTSLWPSLAKLAKAMPGKDLVLVDAGCGNSYLSLALAFLSEREGLPLRVLGIDVNPKVVAQSSARAQVLGLSSRMAFQCASLRDAIYPERLHVVLGLHACDTATDDALALGIEKKADLLAVAPCCQAELANVFRSLSAAPKDERTRALAVLIHSPNLRRDAAATFTDALRVALVRSRGYEVTATEFVPSAHTPKNRLLLCTRRGNFDSSAKQEFEDLRALVGGMPLALERALSGATEQPSEKKAPERSPEHSMEETDETPSGSDPAGRLGH
ncbi:MAG: SAM-dependent methyltransferase [Silvanigrellales bacterium]|nr:SAM-dependent methyltransferase [Silvanigrellales bacterium]